MPDKNHKNPGTIYSGRRILVKRALLLLVYCLSGLPGAFSQHAESSSFRPFPRSGEVLYLVTDKTVYTPGEVIWFAGYLLPGSVRPDSLAPDILSVALLEPGATAFAVRKNYFIGQGLCSGSLLLPDTIPPGTYRLLAGTNLTETGRPVQYFQAVVSIKGISKPPFATGFSINDTLSRDSVFITAQAVLADGRYAMGNGNTISTRLSRQSPKTEKLSFSGSAKLGIAVSDLEKYGYLLHTVTTVDRKTHHFNLQLPRRKDVPSRLAEPVPDRLIIDMASAVPDCDTLSVTVRASEPAAFRIAMSAMNDTVPQVSDIMHVQGKRDMKIPVGPLQRGLHTFSLLDASDSVLAKKRFFAHFGGNNVAEIITEKTTYAPREEVHVKVKLKDRRGNKLSGIFTAYCVLIDRIDPDRKQRIVDYYYLGQWLTSSFPARYYADKSWVAQQLAATDFSRLQYHSLSAPMQKAMIRGRVLRSDNGKIKNPLDVMIYREAALNLVKTDVAGSFSPSAADLAVSEGNPLWIKVVGNGKQQQTDGYAFEISDPMRLPMEALIHLPLNTSWHPPAIQSAMQEILKDSLRRITLKTVEVKGRSVILSDAAYGNKCGDFICEGGVLNCDHNSGGKNITIPVEGRAYRIRTSYPPYYTTMVYRGCTEDNIAPVYTGRRFEGMDSINLASPETVYLSTVFWEPFVVTGTEGDADFRFFTSDLPGRYKIIVEGMDTNGEVFYQEMMIGVEMKRLSQ